MRHKFYKESVVKFALGENRIDSKFKRFLITKKIALRRNSLLKRF